MDLLFLEKGLEERKKLSVFFHSILFLEECQYFFFFENIVFCSFWLIFNYDDFQFFLY